MVLKREARMSYLQRSPEILPLGRLSRIYKDGFNRVKAIEPEFLNKDLVVFTLGGFVVGNNTIEDFYSLTKFMLENSDSCRRKFTERWLIDKYVTSVNAARTHKLTSDGQTRVFAQPLEKIKELELLTSPIDILILDNTTAFMNNREILQMARGLNFNKGPSVNILPSFSAFLSSSFHTFSM